MRSSRISWRRRVFWLDGAGRNEAYRGARILAHIGVAAFILSQGIDPLFFFGGATLSCMGRFLSYVLSAGSLAHQSSHI
jgi:hypothetical protein